MTHVFFSYLHDDWDHISEFHQQCMDEGIPVWIDKDDIHPGARWQDAIRHAIKSGDYFFAFFSNSYAERDATYQNEEITIAIEQLRLRPVDREWFIPIRLDDCDIPDRSIGGGESLRDLQRIDLFRSDSNGASRLIAMLKKKFIDEDLERIFLNSRIRESLNDTRAPLFPTVWLEFPRKCILEAKLDTGSRSSFISSEYIALNDEQSIFPFAFNERRAGNYHFMSHTRRLNMIVHSQAEGASKLVSPAFEVVKNWNNSPFSTFDKIEEFELSEFDGFKITKGVCRLGADFILNHKLYLGLDGVEQKSNLIFRT